MDAGPARIARLLAELGIEHERSGPREWSMRVPSARRGALAVVLSCGERTLTMRAFVIRGPDRNHEAVYRRLLQKNLTTYGWRFALDDVGDVFIVAEAPVESLGADALDGLLGTLATSVDETYEGVMRTGFDVPAGTTISTPPGG